MGVIQRSQYTSEHMILVTGASGLLGANFVYTAKNVYEGVVGVCHKHSFHMPGLETVQADLTRKDIVRELLRHYHPCWVVHCAALTNIDWCEKHREETWRVNVEMSRGLAAAARQVGASFVYISTDSVFDGKTGYWNEKDTPSPVNVYSESKLVGERAVLDELAESLIVRTNIYGWNIQKRLSLAEWILSRLEEGEYVPGFYDVVFTPILVNDLSEVIVEMMELRLSGLYHVAGSQACSKYEFALQEAEVFGLEKNLIQPVSVADSSLKAPRPKKTSLQTEKVSQALGRPMPDVKTGLQRFKMLGDSGFVKKIKALRGG